MSKISVLGIFVADISFSGNKIPSIGETILGDKYNIGPGGKGCNQAIAITRLGGKVNFISKIGKDDYGQLAINTLNQNNIEIIIRVNKLRDTLFCRGRAWCGVINLLTITCMTY